MKKITLGLILILGLFFHNCASQQKSNDETKYVFFLHNRFVQLFDLNTQHPEYGKAEYIEIVDKFRQSGFIVLSEKRPKDADSKKYASKIVHQIDSLILLGVKPENITIIGTSMGGYIAQYVSTILKKPKLNFVLVGCYRDIDLKEIPEIQLSGNILSIYEKTDTLGVYMQKRIETSKNTIPHFKEIELHTNKKHGFLYHPMDEWMQPAMQWAKGDYNLQAKLSSGKILAEKNIFKKNNDSIPYRLVYPDKEVPPKKYPLLIYLHGSGNRGNDNEKPLEKFSAFFSDSNTSNKFPSYILIPQCPANDVWVSFPDFPNSLSASTEPTHSAKLVLGLIQQLKATKNIDTDRIYLTGYSMGGEGTFDLLIREPKLFACAVPLASVADTSKANLVSNIPIWAFHGDCDKVNDVKHTRIMIEAIKSKGGNPMYTELKGVGHDCQNDAYLNEKLWKWIFKQHK